MYLDTQKISHKNKHEHLKQYKRVQASMLQSTKFCTQTISETDRHISQKGRTEI